MSEFLSQRSRIFLLCAGFATLLGVGILVSIRSDLFVVSDPTLNSDSETPVALDDGRYSQSVRIIKTLDDWNSVTGVGQHVVFIDCNWNVLMVAFRRPFVVCGMVSQRDRLSSGFSGDDRVFRRRTVCCSTRITAIEWDIYARHEDLWRRGSDPLAKGWPTFGLRVVWRVLARRAQTASSFPQSVSIVPAANKAWPQGPLRGSPSLFDQRATAS